MNPKHVNAYGEYLEAEVRKARLARDEAVAQMILVAAESIARYVAKVTRAVRPGKGGHARRSHA